MDSTHYYVGNIAGHYLAQPLSQKQFMTLTQEVATNRLEIWTLADQIMFVSLAQPGVITRLAEGTIQLLAKAAGSNTFFTIRYAFEREEAERSINFAISDEANILRAIHDQPLPHMDHSEFRRQVIELARVHPFVSESEYSELERRCREIDRLCEVFLSGENLTNTQFAGLLVEYNIWQDQPERMKSFIQKTLYQTNRYGMHLFISDLGAGRPMGELNALVRLLAQRIEDYPRPKPNPALRCKEE